MAENGRNDSEPRALLVNYAGYPSSLDSLMPDNGLANLAGSLRRAGWSPRILDFATTDMIGRLVPASCRRRLKWLLLRYMAGMKLGLRPGARLSADFQSLYAEIAQHAQRVQDELAAEIVADIRARRILFVGFKLWTGAGQEGAVRIAQNIRAACPDIRLFAGGPHVEYFGQALLDHLPPVFDALALGEGEETIVELGDVALGRKTLAEVAGIAWRQADGRIASQPVRPIADLDTLADPVYAPDVYPAMAGDRKLKMIMLDESRGCPFACHFCFHPVKSGRQWRVRAPVRVADLMERLRQETGSALFRLAGSNPPPDHRRELAEELARRGAPFEYVSFGHTRSKDEPFDLLARSGCISLFFGVESGCQRILDRAANKKTTVENIRSHLLDAKRAGILTSASLIVPMPFDDDDSLRETVELMAETQPAGVSVYLPIVMPGTAWFDRAESFGIEFQGDPLEAMMRYQVRFLMPPPLWDPLPYSIGGARYEDMVRTASRVQNDLEKRGVLTGMNDALLLLADKLGMPPRRMRDRNRKLFMTADRNGIERLVAQFHRALGMAHFSWHSAARRPCAGGGKR